MRRSVPVIGIFITYLAIAGTIDAERFDYSTGKQAHLVLVDSGQKEEYAYQPFIDIARSVGFAVTYVPISHLLDHPDDVRKICNNGDVLFFILERPFLAAPQSHAGKKYYQLYAHYAKQPHKMIGLCFPAISVPIPTFNFLWHPLGFVVKPQSIKKTSHHKPTSYTDHYNEFTRKYEVARLQNAAQSIYKQQDLAYFAFATDRFLRYPLETRERVYETSLLPPNPKGPEVIPDNKRIIFQQDALTIPQRETHFSNVARSLFPFGIFWINPLRNNSIFVTSISMMTFSSIAESFRLYPIKKDDLNTIHRAIAESMIELYSFATQLPKTKHSYETDKLIRTSYPPLPSSVKKAEQAPLADTNTIWGWVDLRSIQQNSKDIRKLASYIIKGHIPKIWLSINPAYYFSVNGSRTPQKNPQEYNAMVTRTKEFINALRTKAHKYNTPLPQIYIGFEIAWNSTKDNLRTIKVPPVRDLYDNEYEDVPSPISYDFWKHELAKPLKQFMKMWNKETNNYPVAGVIIDFEMYAKKLSAYHSTVGFEEQTLHPFVSGNIKNIEHLVLHQQTQQYFSHLETQATKLGKKLKTKIEKHCPNGEVGCYAPHISPNWFYRGMYSGLSHPKHKIHLLTFNNEFVAHESWLKKHGIHAKHHAALMLSKIKSVDDFSQIERLLNDHHGIWLNRLSWVARPHGKGADELEHTPLNSPDKTRLMEHLKKIETRSSKK